MRLCSRSLPRPRLALTTAVLGGVLSVVAACNNRLADEPGVGGVIDRPVAVLSASQNDLTTVELYLVSENGNSSVKVPTFSGAKFEVRWSADGRRLAIAGNTLGPASSAVASTSDVFVLNADGTGLRQLTTDGHSGSLHWLPDGRLVFAHDTGNEPVQWFAVPAAGGAPVPITLRNGAPVYTPDWSRVGAQMTFNADVTVYTAAVDGSAESALVSGFLPRWSPTGDRIAYVGPLGGVPKVFVVRASGPSGARVVADLSDLTDAPSGLAWSPDGSRLAWVRPTATSVRAVVAWADGSSAPVPLVQRTEDVVAFDVDVDWRPTLTP